jgi:hypothetical protein
LACAQACAPGEGNGVSACAQACALEEDSEDLACAQACALEEDSEASACAQACALEEDSEASACAQACVPAWDNKAWDDKALAQACSRLAWARGGTAWAHGKKPQAWDALVVSPEGSADHTRLVPSHRHSFFHNSGIRHVLLVRRLVHL